MDTLEKNVSNQYALNTDLYIDINDKTLHAEIITISDLEIQFAVTEELYLNTYNVNIDILTIPYDCKIQIIDRGFDRTTEKYHYTAILEGLSDLDIMLIRKSLVIFKNI